MSERTESRDGDAQQIPVRNESKRRRWLLLLLLLLLLLTSTGILAGVLVHGSKDYDSSADFQAFESSHTSTTVTPVSAQNITIDSSADFQAFKSTHISTTVTPVSAQNITIGSRGRGFIVLFMTNVVSTTKSFYVTSENGVQMNVSTSPSLNAFLKKRIDRSQEIRSNKRIIVPAGMELVSFRTEFKSILIETSHDVFLISHDEGHGTVGSTTHIPLHKLSNQYVVISMTPSEKSQFAIAAIDENTSIVITFKYENNLPLNIGGEAFNNGDVYNFTLNRFETYEIAHDTDLTGTTIETSAPVAAFSGNACNQIEGFGACDHLIEQLPPLANIDTTYIVPPNSDDRDTLIRLTAIKQSNVTVTISGVKKYITLNQLESFDTKISTTQTCYVLSESKVLVTSFGLHSKSSNMGDPSMTFVPGLNQYLNYYKIVVPSGYDHNYVSIMIKKSSEGMFRINEASISRNNIVFEDTVTIGFIDYNVKLIKVAEGELTALTLDQEPFGLMFTGTTEYKAYGFSGNSLLL